ncbi:FtsK/SpoIIIE domain-containing protein [Nocardia sp. NPDC051756]|uniref:FtsK/SpoIIIE domain-containing protein n=1 Tax=Nocardia sp. NPDC051756 TaxID=3154751 RepID=UPI00343183AA
MMLSDLAVLGSGAVIGGCGLMWLRSLGAGVRPITVADIAAVAPAELRTAVTILADPHQTNMMLAALDLGSPETGFPYVDGWDYDVHGLYADVVMLGGQKLKDWNNEDVRAQFATYLGVAEVTVSSPAPSWVRLQVRVFDTLAAPTSASVAVSNDVDLEAIPVGVLESGETWRLALLYRHLLLAGGTNAGKGGLVWAIIAGLAPAIKAGLVELWVADPKGGMEFWRGRKLMTRCEYTDEGIVTMMADAEQLMLERAERCREAGIEKHVPSTDEPLIVIIVDEAASMTSYAEKALIEKFERHYGKILTQGRAPGFCVITCVQDPSKETLPMRQLIPVRIALRLDEKTQINMVHGDSARDRGARCDEIPYNTPGVAYVREDGTPNIVRARSYFVSRDDIAYLVEHFTPDYNREHERPVLAEYADFDPDDLGDENEDGVAA